MPKSKKSDSVSSTSDKKSCRGRKMINQLWRRKRNIFKNALKMAKDCDREIYICVQDKKFGGLTEFSSNKDIDFDKIKDLNENS